MIEVIGKILCVDCGVDGELFHARNEKHEWFLCKKCLEVREEEEQKEDEFEAMLNGQEVELELIKNDALLYCNIETKGQK